MDKKTPQHGFTGQTESIIDWPSPSQVHIPLVQHKGQAAPVIVSEGDAVRVGQPLTHSDNLLEVPVHASITGIVESISKQRITLRKTSAEDNESLKENGGNKVQRTSHSDYAELFNNWSPDQFVRKIHSAGLVGLGGSCYPVAAKISKLNGMPADMLLINAAECDPSISCDEALLNQSLDAIATGICLAQLATRPRKTIIGIESDKSEPGQRLLKLVIEHDLQQHPESNAKSNTELHVVPSVYPNGAESLLMSDCLGRTVTPAEIHNSKLISFNIGTCYAISQALVLGKPGTHRIATIVDSKLNRVNLRLPVGTPISDLASHFNESPDCAVIVGGEMMGRQASSTSVVTKASNCIQFRQSQPQPNILPCVRCSLCVDACPVNLMPQFLLAEATSSNHKNLITLKLDNCIECTCCDRVCPSNIPLAAIFSSSKKEVARDTWSRNQAELAKTRFAKRQTRLENNKQREFKKLDKKQTNLNQKEKTGQEAKRKLVEEALQRAKNKKQEQSKTRSVHGKDGLS